MGHPADQILDSVNNVLGQVKLMSDRRPDAKIGSAANVFNALLREAKKHVPEAPLIQGMEDLKDHDTVVAYLSSLGLLQAQLLTASNAAYEAARSPSSSSGRPPYA